MTRLELETAVYDWLNKGAAASIDATTQRRIRQYLNAEIRDVLGRPGFEPLRRPSAPVTFATVSGQDAYGLPLEFARIDRIIDRTNQRVLDARGLDWIRRAAPNPSATTGTPQAWAPYGFQAVQLHPSNASELFVKSSAADTTQTVAVAGFVTGGLFRAPSVVTLTGTTAVSISAAITTWEEVTKFDLSATATGVISLHEDSGSGTTLAQIPIGKTSSRYQAIRLYPTPASAATLYVDGLLALTDLARDTDVPPCPEDFHELFVYGACWRECLKLVDARAAEFKALREERIGQLRGFVNDHASVRIVPGAVPTGVSNLGPWFPADRMWA